LCTPNKQRNNPMDKILVIGAGGQLGTELVSALQLLHGRENVVASDIRPESEVKMDGTYICLDVLDEQALHEAVIKHEISQVYHLAAVLSARGESHPLFAWDLNMKSLLHVLELGRIGRIKKIFWPSSIAVFGPDTPKENTPQYTRMNPTTVYGISKLAGERWCDYYYRKYGVDVRSVRYPGLIGYKSLPGGGTTDYAVDIFYQAVQGRPFSCFLQAGTRLPMMYMEDAVNATLKLMQADPSRLSVRSSYNLAGISFSPDEIYAEIKTHFPEFAISYQPDYRQAIADSWPSGIDDTVAQNDWDWQPHFDLARMTSEIIGHLTEQFQRA